MVEVIEDHIVYGNDGSYIEEYRVCPNCNSKIYPVYVNEYSEEMYNCICPYCNKVVFDLFSGLNSEIKHLIVTQFDYGGD